MTEDRLMRESQFRWTLTVPDVGTYLFDKKSGGGISSSESDYHSGGMGAAEPVGGDQSTAVIVLERAVRTLRDQQARAELARMPGNTRGQLVGQWLDAKGIAFGTPEVYNGLVTALDPPAHDSNSQNLATITVNFKPDGNPV